jgi:hypothetical protein
MNRGIFPPFQILREFAGDILPERFPMPLASPHVLALEQRYLKSHLLLEEIEKRGRVSVHWSRIVD